MSIKHFINRSAQQLCIQANVSRGMLRLILDDDIVEAMHRSSDQDLLDQLASRENITSPRPDKLWGIPVVVDNSGVDVPYLTSGRLHTALSRKTLMTMLLSEGQT